MKVLFPMQSVMLLAVLMVFSCQTDTTMSKATVDYPETRKDSTVDVYHGTEIADPYRWLEDDSSEETMAWVDEQNDVTFDYLSQIPFRTEIRDRLEKLWNYEKFGTPFQENDKYYFFKNDGLQNQYVLYVQDDLDSEAEVFLDPNTLSEDGTSSLGGMAFSKDGKYFIYAVSEGGSDWRTAYVKDLETGRLLEDKIEWIKFSGLSYHDGGFFYSRYPEPSSQEKLDGRNQNQKVYFHKIGTPQSEDLLIHENPDFPDRGFGSAVTEDGEYLVLLGWESTSGNSLLVKNLREDNSELIRIIDNFEYNYDLVDHENGMFYVLTNDDANKNRLVAIDPNKPQRENWRTILPESDNRLQSVSAIGGQLVARYLKNASHLLIRYDYDGKELGRVSLPGVGTVGSLSGEKDQDVCFLSFTSFTTPSSILKYDISKDEMTTFKKPKVDINPEDYITEQVWFTSKDGTQVPMFVTHKKDIELDGARPTLLYGYGGFDISILPSFSLSKMILLEQGGVYAVANIRGGGEFGTEWHMSGTKERKQNVFDDFIAAAEYLIDKKYTSSDHLAIEGGSNGGLLVGACITQRPDLYAAAFPRVGVLDMLRYHEFTIGRAWSTDYGLSETPEGFEYLKAYSPLHNVKEVEYPATMVMTADHDDRVVPAHSFKFAATLQEKQQGNNPTLIRIEKSAGHGAGKPTSKRIEEEADMMAFLLYNMDEEYTNPLKD